MLTQPQRTGRWKDPGNWNCQRCYTLLHYVWIALDCSIRYNMYFIYNMECNMDLYCICIAFSLFGLMARLWVKLRQLSSRTSRSSRTHTWRNYEKLLRESKEWTQTATFCKEWTKVIKSDCKIRKWLFWTPKSPKTCEVRCVQVLRCKLSLKVLKHESIWKHIRKY